MFVDKPWSKQPRARNLSFRMDDAQGGEEGNGQQHQSKLHQDELAEELGFTACTGGVSATCSAAFLLATAAISADKPWQCAVVLSPFMLIHLINFICIFMFRFIETPKVEPKVLMAILVFPILTVAIFAVRAYLSITTPLWKDIELLLLSSVVIYVCVAVFSTGMWIVSQKRKEQFETTTVRVLAFLCLKVSFPLLLSVSIKEGIWMLEVFGTTIAALSALSFVLFHRKKFRGSRTGMDYHGEGLEKNSTTSKSSYIPPRDPGIIHGARKGFGKTRSLSSSSGCKNAPSIILEAPEDEMKLSGKRTTSFREELYQAFDDIELDLH